MTSPAVTIHQAGTVREAGDLLSKHGISALPVLDDERRLVGIVSQMDLIRLDSSKTPPEAGQPRGEPVRVADVMTAQVVTVDVDTDLHTVAQCLSDSRVRQVPVMAGADVVGVVSRRDLVRWMARSDATLALDVVAYLNEEARRLTNLEVEVHQGVAQIQGEARPDTLELAVSLARTVPGVADATIRRQD